MITNLKRVDQNYQPTMLDLPHGTQPLGLARVTANDLPLAVSNPTFLIQDGVQLFPILSSSDIDELEHPIT
jgi:hypothetical protein